MAAAVSSGPAGSIDLAPGPVDTPVILPDGAR